MTPTRDLDTAAARLAGEDAIDTRLLDEAVADLNQIYTTKALETARLIGKYILERFFHGDLNIFRSQGRRHVSFRMLAARPDLKFSYTYLWTCVAVVEQFDHLPHDLAEALPLSHHRMLLPIRDSKEKVKLAKLAVTEGLSKRAFAEAIRPRRTPRGSNKTLLAPGEHPIARALAQIKTVLNEALASPGFDNLDGLPTTETDSVINELEHEVEKLSHLLITLRNRSNGTESEDSNHA
jgi:hypothetical protein